MLPFNLMLAVITGLSAFGLASGRAFGMYKCDEILLWLSVWSKV